MLRTDDRELFSEALAAPDDYQLDLLVGTTYSMQLSALLSVPLSLTFADWEDDHGGPVGEPVASLEAVRRYADRITVFCQAGATAATEQPPLVASWLEDVVVPVAAPLGGVFHPKLWVARYSARNGADPPQYRTLCASRNLTFDRCWDTLLTLDGAPSPRGGVVGETAPLADFIATLPNLACSAVSRARCDDITQLATELRRVRFEPPEGCDGLAFHPLGIPGHTTDPFTTRRSRMLVISPFVSASVLERLDTEKPREANVLVSREEELERLPTAKLSYFGHVQTLTDLGGAQEETESDGRLSGLHTKLYIAEAGHTAHLWTGSANATNAAFAKNVEFLVRVDGRRKVIGIDAVLGGQDDPTSLAHLLVDVPPRETVAEPDGQAELDYELDRIAHDLAERRITAVVSTDGLDHAIELIADPPPMLPHDVRLRCWPLTGSGARHPEPVAIKDRQIALFRGVALADITAFFVMEVLLQRDDLEAAKTFLVRATLEGAPAGRLEAIMRALLDSPEKFLRLVRALLAFDSPDGPGGGGLGFIAGLATGGDSGWKEPPLLESMLKALAEHPASITEIAALVDYIRPMVDDLRLTDFLAVWEPIATVSATERRVQA